MSYPPPQVAQSAEVVPSLDETRPIVGPNLASSPELCKAVLDFCQRRYVYPYVLQQQPFHRVWQRIDDAFRVKGAAWDLDISAVDPMTKVTVPDAKGRGGIVDRNDGYSSRVYPPTLHKQIVAKTDLSLSIAWSDGLPVRVVKPETEYEHPLYNPTQQSVDAANEELEKCAREIKLKRQDRKARGSLAKYGHAWVAVDFRYEQEDKPITFHFPPESNMANALLQAKMQEFGQPPVNVDQQAMTATWTQRVIKTMRTDFTPLRVDDVFVDQTMPADDLSQQLCPCIRSRVNRLALFGNDYDPEKNPFGYLNCQQAMQDQGQQWVFTYDSNFQDELRKKWGLSDQGLVQPKDAIKQKWTLYPMLAIDPATGALDDGSGLECPTCAGKGKVPMVVQGMDEMGQPVEQETGESQDCPQCQGRQRIFIRPERYVVEAFGNLDTSSASATCLRIQRNPTPKDKIPLLFNCALSEDTAGAIPLSKAEAAMKSVDQEATCYNQYFDAKNGIINPVFLIPEDADKRVDYNRPGENIHHYGNPDAFKPLRPVLDATQNILMFSQECRGDTIDIMGVRDTLLGEIQSGRRSASEIQNSYDASKVPLVQEVDAYNEDITGGWAQFHLDNMEAFADRDYIRKVTGRTTFGKVQLFSATADEFMKRQATIGNFQYIAQFLGARPDANLQPVFSAMCKLMKLPINPDEVFPDGGMKKSRADGLRLVTQILGDGQFVPPSPSDPHAIYIEIFEQALQDPYWRDKTPETIPLLAQRLQMQLQLQLQQQQAMLAAQQQSMMMQMQAKGGGQKGNGNQPAMSNKPAATVGGQNQQLMGAATPQ